MNGTSQYKTTTAFEKICGLKKEVRIVQGGKGSSKTISILMLFILLAISKRQNLILSVVAESLPNLKSGALRDFEKILKSWGLFSQFKINKTDRTYTFGTNMIEFFSVEGEASRLGSRRTHLYINEASEIKFSTYIELYSRTSVFTIMDYNPRRKFWAHKELIGQAHVDFIILNFSDNEYIPKNEKSSILWFKKKADEGSKYFLNKWRVLGLGLLGITEGVISKVEKVTHNIIYEAKISYLDGRNTKAKLTRVVSSYSLIAPEINFEYNSPPIKGIEKIDDKVYFGDKVRIEGVESFMLLRETWTDSLGNVTNEIVHNEENPNDVKTETFINQLSQYILEGIKNFNTD